MTASTHVAALYVRISRDRAGRSESIAEQERRGRAYAADRWPDAPVEVYADNAITAADEDTHRPGYEQLRTAIAAGRVAHLWTVEQTRLQRTEVGWFRLAAELAAAGVDEVHTARDGVVRVADEVAGIKAVLAAAEVRRLTSRVRDKMDSLAAQGRPSGGRQFGYRPARNDAGEATLEVVPEEAEHIRWAAVAVLDGWSLTSIADELNARGAPLVRGGKGWTTNQVRNTLTKGSVAGLRVHHGQVVGRATWAPILDEVTWRQVAATLDTRAHVTNRNGDKAYITHRKRAARRYLLTGGVAVCGLCSAPLVGQQRRWNATTPLQPYYSCHPSRGGCSRIGIKGVELEHTVRDRLLDELDRRATFGATVAEDTAGDVRARLVDAIAEVDRRHVELARRWASGALPGAAWDAARGDLDVERARLDRELAEVPPPAGRVDAGELREGWDLMTVEERRHVVGLYVAEVTVAPAVLGRQRYDAERVSVQWRTV